MLPDLRALIAAAIASVGLLMIAFGAVAAFRVAQDSHGALHADLAKRARMAELPLPVRRPVMVIDTPGPHIAPFPPLPVREVKDAPVATELHDLPTPIVPSPIADTPPAAAPEPVAALPAPEPPMGGPLADPKPSSDAERVAARAERAKKLAAARKARAARLARQRKAAARRAALARAKQLQLSQQSATSFNMFGTPSFNYGSGTQ
jgi:type IV secretory pathway VirB10-like protein